MRSVASRVRIASGAALAVAGLAWMVSPLGARPAAPPPLRANLAPPLMAGGGRSDEPEAPRVHFKAPVSADEAAVWIALQKKMAFKFPNETPFEDFLKHIVEATVTKDDPEGLKIYVDPVGLQEAEKTMASPITLNLGSVRLETGLRFVLAQLDLTFSVHPDGIVFITAKDSKDRPGDDPNELILDRLEALQKQVAALQGLLAHHEPPMPAPAPAPKH